MSAMSAFANANLLLNLVELPEGVQWIASSASQKSAYRGAARDHALHLQPPSTKLVAWLYSEGNFGLGLLLVSERLEISLAEAAYAARNPDARAALAHRIQEHVRVFAATLDAGTAIRIQDGGDLP